MFHNWHNIQFRVMLEPCFHFTQISAIIYSVIKISGWLLSHWHNCSLLGGSAGRSSWRGQDLAGWSYWMRTVRVVARCCVWSSPVDPVQCFSERHRYSEQFEQFSVSPNYLYSYFSDVPCWWYFNTFNRIAFLDGTLPLGNSTW